MPLVKMLMSEGLDPVEVGLGPRSCHPRHRRRKESCVQRDRLMPTIRNSYLNLSLIVAKLTTAAPNISWEYTKGKGD